MLGRTPLDRLHFFLMILVVSLAVANTVSYFAYKEVRQDLYIAESPSRLTDDVSQVQEDTTLNDSSMLFTVQSGDTLLKIFSDAGVAIQDSYLITTAINKVYSDSKLRIGNQIEIKFLPDPPQSEAIDDYYSKVSNIKVITDDKVIEVDYDASQQNYTACLVVIPLTKSEVYYRGKINDSLYLSATNNRISPHGVMEFIKLFSYDVDFQRDIQLGDEFEILYNFYVNEKGQKIKDGVIEYAALTLSNKKKEIYLYKNDDQSDYFNSSGESIKKTLLRTPISGAKITSQFGMRKHPILGFSRMHKGLDYGAPKGTPILAAGDGIVQFIKHDARGYGKYLLIKHSSKYSTLYGHLDRFANSLSKGSRVSQGDVIGFVGATGMATGPHLHYEVHDRGVQINPAQISFAKMPPLTGKLLQAFKNHVDMISKKISELQIRDKQ